jgi:hypothetical protein
MNKCLQNNARMQQLGLPALAQLMSATTKNRQGTENHNHIDDPDFDCNAEEDAHSDGDLSDDSLDPETKSRHGSCKQKVKHIPLCQALLYCFIHVSFHKCYTTFVNNSLVLE